MDIFGSTSPKKMPLHFFWKAIDIDYSTAIRADITTQDYSVCPRHWYIDARFQCCTCNKEFLWLVEEQRTWFEIFHFYVDSNPNLCQDCRAKRRDAVQLRQEYDALVNTARSSGSTEQKQRIVEIVNELEAYWSCVPDKMKETRETFQGQLSKAKS